MDVWWDKSNNGIFFLKGLEIENFNCGFIILFSSSMMLEYLPSGVLFEICKHLSWQDVTHMGQTCRRFNELCKMATIWYVRYRLLYISMPLFYDIII